MTPGEQLTSVTIESLKEANTGLRQPAQQDQLPIADSLEVVLLPQSVATQEPLSDDDVFFIDDTISIPGPAGADGIAYSGGGGGFGGGGFGAGGGFGGGRLLPLAALGVGIAALADDNNSGGAPPSSPFNP